MSSHWNPAINAARGEFPPEKFEQLSNSSRTVCSRIPSFSKHCDPLGIPIYQSTVYRTNSVDDYARVLNEGGYIYQRLGNPTSETAEVIINELEGGKGTLVYSSGSSALSAVMLCFLKAGDHLICQQPMYSGSSRFVTSILGKFGIEITLVPAGCAVQEYRKALRENTRFMYAESPSNPDMSVIDLEEFGRLSRELGDKVLTLVDGTFASPVLQQPLKHGIDISLHSCSKYLGGHTDLIAGCITVSSVANWKILKNFMGFGGSPLAPFDSFLLTRGLKTVVLRTERICQTALQIAQFLEQQPKVVRVFYPGLHSHPQHSIARKQMKAFGGMIGFEMASKAAGRKLVESLKLVVLGVSLGGTESLICHPATSTHGPMLMSDEDRKRAKISDGFIRFSIGLEDPEDLKADLLQALTLV